MWKNQSESIRQRDEQVQRSWGLLCFVVLLMMMMVMMALVLQWTVRSEGVVRGQVTLP